MPTTWFHFTVAVWIMLFFFGAVGIDLDHWGNRCDFLKQQCKNQDIKLLFLHKWLFPLTIIGIGLLFLGIGWLLHLYLDTTLNVQEVLPLI